MKLNIETWKMKTDSNLIVYKTTVSIKFSVIVVNNRAGDFLSHLSSQKQHEFDILAVICILKKE